LLLVIFGAGATYDAAPLPPGDLRPPLAKQLFEERPDFGSIIDTYPAVRPLVSRLRAASLRPGISIEAVFEEMVAQSLDRAPTRRQLAAARFYIHDAIETSVDKCVMRGAHGVTNYHELVDRIDTALAPKRDPVVYVTFNYDQLPEVALSDALGHEFSVMDAYTNNPQRRLIKLHGSVNWRRRVVGIGGAPLAAPYSGTDRSRNAHWLLGQLESIRVTDEYEIGAPYQFVQLNPIHLPAIAIPTETKTSSAFELPPSHLDTLTHALPHVTQLLVVGWRGRENHFWELWNRARTTDEKVSATVVDENGEAAGSAAQYLNDHGKGIQARPVAANGFSDYMRSSSELQGLSL
jgi:hypothetical protein